MRMGLVRLRGPQARLIAGPVFHAARRTFAHPAPGRGPQRDLDFERERDPEPDRDRELDREREPDREPEFERELVREREEDDFFREGTLPPARRASESPIAMACRRLFTFRPEPLLSVPRFILCMARSTFFDAFFPYLAMRRDLLMPCPRGPGNSARYALSPSYGERPARILVKSASSWEQRRLP